MPTPTKLSPLLAVIAIIGSCLLYEIIHAGYYGSWKEAGEIALSAVLGAFMAVLFCWELLDSDGGADE